MFTRDNDLMMLIAKILLILLRIGIIIGIVGAAIGVIANGFILYATLTGTAGPSGEWWPKGPVPLATALIRVALPLLTIAMLGQVNAFLDTLSAIMDTVAAGDPFTPDNARRLQRMGLFAFVAQLLASAIRLLASSIGTEHVPHIYHAPGLGLSPAGIVLVLTLLILARVFARGTALRDDLEGTV